MTDYTPEDIVSIFDQAKNINAAVKKFLKNEVAGNAANEKFAKSARAALLSSVPDGKLTFIKNHLPDYEPHMLVLASYCHQEVIAATTSEVITKYADDFNKTYTPGEEKITVTDKATFKKIVLAVQDIVDASLKKANLSSSPFFKKVVFFNIFDRAVLEEVLPIVS